MPCFLYKIMLEFRLRKYEKNQFFPNENSGFLERKESQFMYSSAYVWAKVLIHLEERLGAVSVSAWFDDAEIVELN